MTLCQYSFFHLKRLDVMLRKFIQGAGVSSRLHKSDAKKRKALLECTLRHSFCGRSDEFLLAPSPISRDPDLLPAVSGPSLFIMSGYPTDLAAGRRGRWRTLRRGRRRIINWRRWIFRGWIIVRVIGRGPPKNRRSDRDRKTGRWMMKSAAKPAMGGSDTRG